MTDEQDAMDLQKKAMDELMKSDAIKAAEEKLKGMSPDDLTKNM